MSESTDVAVSIDVNLDPAAAFEIFTGEIDRWWRPGPQNWNDRFRAVGIRIEPRVGGRWLEIHDNPEEVFDCGRITVWQPPSRFVFLYHDIGHDIDDTEIEVRFEPVGGKTRVTIRHRGWEKVSPDIVAEKRRRKASGWGHILGWYAEWAEWGSPRRVRNPVWQQSTRLDRERRAAKLMGGTDPSPREGAR